MSDVRPEHPLVRELIGVWLDRSQEDRSTLDGSLGWSLGFQDAISVVSRYLTPVEMAVLVVEGGDHESDPSTEGVGENLEGRSE